jgi:aspartate/glutamate racemase
MMTNLGDYEYGVEFRPQEVVEALPAAEIGDIARDAQQRVPVEHTLGILTGNGSQAGRLLWRLIDERIRHHPQVRFRGDTGLPHVIVESLPQLGLSMEMQERLVLARRAVLEGVSRLCERGATVIGIACNAAQCFAEEISDVCHSYGAQFVPIVDTTLAMLRTEGIERVVFLGMDGVAGRGTSGFRRLAAEIQCDQPDQELVGKIRELTFLVKEIGVVSETRNLMRDVVRRAAPREDAVVLVAVAELSVLIASQRRSQRRIIDTLQILADRMADIYIHERRHLDVNPDVEVRGAMLGGPRSLVCASGDVPILADSSR